MQRHVVLSHKVYNSYSIDGFELSSYRNVRPRLIFKGYVNKKIAKAYSMLCFLKKSCAGFDNLKFLTSIYNVHVRSHLEYASVVHMYHLVNKFKRCSPLNDSLSVCLCLAIFSTVFSLDLSL